MENMEYIENLTVGMTVGGVRFLGNFRLTEDMLFIVAEYNVDTFGNGIPDIFEIDNHVAAAAIPLGAVCGLRYEKKLLVRKVIIEFEKEGISDSVVLDLGLADADRVFGNISKRVQL